MHLNITARHPRRIKSRIEDSTDSNYLYIDAQDGQIPLAAKLGGCAKYMPQVFWAAKCDVLTPAVGQTCCRAPFLHPR